MGALGIGRWELGLQNVPKCHTFSSNWQYIACVRKLFEGLGLVAVRLRMLRDSVSHPEVSIVSSCKIWIYNNSNIMIIRRENVTFCNIS